MPNWKKVLVSGSNAELNRLNISTSLTASGLLYPASDGISGQVLGTDGLGNLSFSDVTIAQVSTVAASFASTSSITVQHNFNSKNVIVSAYDNSDFYFVPETINLLDNNRVKLTFSNPSTGHVVVAKGGHIVSASMQGNQGLVGPQGFQGLRGFQGFQGFQGIQGIQGPIREVSEVSTVSASFSATSSITVTHNFNSKSVVVSAYDASDFYFVPNQIKLLDNNRVKLFFTSPSTGYVVVAKGGHIVSGSLYIAGPQGLQGTTGIQGTNGTVGTQGFQGNQGPQGNQGIQGTNGTVGVNGAQGNQGTQGTQGNQGNQGNQGIQGTAGTNVSQTSTISASFVATSSITIAHNFNSKNVVISA
jgi:hypothetical protein